MVFGMIIAEAYHARRECLKKKKNPQITRISQIILVVFCIACGMIVA
jgi:hypothetical protein